MLWSLSLRSSSQSVTRGLASAQPPTHPIPIGSKRSFIWTITSRWSGMRRFLACLAWSPMQRTTAISTLMSNSPSLASWVSLKKRTSIVCVKNFVGYSIFMYTFIRNWSCVGKEVSHLSSNWLSCHHAGLKDWSLFIFLCYHHFETFNFPRRKLSCVRKILFEL